MLEKNEQEISNVNGSVVQQANGNIINCGLSYNDVKAISQDVISQYLSSLTAVAYDTLKKRIEEFASVFKEKLEHLEAPHAEEKLKTPNMQLFMRETMEEYAKSEDANTREELVDLLIERLKVNESNDEKFLIEEAIKVLPQLTKKQGNFLAALILRRHFRRKYSSSLNFKSNLVWALVASLVVSILFTGITAGAVLLTSTTKDILTNDYNVVPNYNRSYNVLVSISYYSKYLLKYITNLLGESLYPFIFFFFPLFFLFFTLRIYVVILTGCNFCKDKSFETYIMVTEKLHLYVYPKKMNNNLDMAHLREIRCCIDGKKKSLFGEIEMAKETYDILFGQLQWRNDFLLSRFPEYSRYKSFPFRKYFIIREIYRRQKEISNVDLTPLGVYIGKRIFTKNTGIQGFDVDTYLKISEN